MTELDVNMSPIKTGSEAERRLSLSNKKSLSLDISTLGIPSPPTSGLLPDRPPSMRGTRRPSRDLVSSPLDIPSILYQNVNAVSPTSLGKRTYSAGGSNAGSVSTSPVTPIRRKSSTSVLVCNLDEVHDRMYSTIQRLDHRSGIRIFKQSFTGEAFVAWIMGSGHAVTTAGAVDIGVKMMTNKMIKCCDSKAFELIPDNSHYYKFCRDEYADHKKSVSSSNNAREVEEEDEEAVKDIDASTTFQEILDNPKWLRLFEDHCRKEVNSENLYFWSAVVDYRNLHEDFLSAISEGALQLLNHYIGSDAKEGLNVSASIREDTIEKYNKYGATATLFDRAAEEVYALMRKDAFRRFMNSHTARKMSG